MPSSVSTTLPQIRAGKVKGLGVSSLQRSPLVPDLPTMTSANTSEIWRPLKPQ
jgi:tripartite-type tricarboxylate transporter receptor subunit TctC